VLITQIRKQIGDLQAGSFTGQLKSDGPKSLGRNDGRLLLEVHKQIPCVSSHGSVNTEKEIRSRTDGPVIGDNLQAFVERDSENGEEEWA
jgi:hypothetical protein